MAKEGKGVDRREARGHKCTLASVRLVIQMRFLMNFAGQIVEHTPSFFVYIFMYQARLLHRFSCFCVRSFMREGGGGASDQT